MKKKIFSVIFILLLCICCISLAAKNYGRIKHAVDSLLNLNQEDQPHANTGGVIEAGDLNYIDEEQLCSADMPVNIKGEVGNKIPYEFQFQITNIHTSRQLEEQFKTKAPKRANLMIWYDYSVMDEDYTLKKDFYYLYATVNVKKISDECEFSPYILKYAVNDNGKMLYIRSDFQNNLYNGYEFDSAVFAYLETDGKHLISSGVTGNFMKGEDVTYNVCYMITDEMLSKDNIYLAYPYGGNYKDALLDKDQKYIKVSLGG